MSMHARHWHTVLDWLWRLLQAYCTPHAESTLAAASCGLDAQAVVEGGLRFIVSSHVDGCSESREDQGRGQADQRIALESVVICIGFLLL